jgi:ParB-like nuclease domain
MEIVEELQKKLANLAQRVTQMSRARSTPQAPNETGECGVFVADVGPCHEPGAIFIFAQGLVKQPEWLAAMSRARSTLGVGLERVTPMDHVAPTVAAIELEQLGERLSPLRLRPPEALREVERSLSRHGQLVAVVCHRQAGTVEIVDGFKRLIGARALRWSALRAEIHEVTGPAAWPRI